LALTYEEPRALTQTAIRRQLSPDGRRIVLSTPTQPSSSAGYRLTIVDLATGRTTMLTDGAQRDTFPAWSPDGRSIAFLRSNARGDDTAVWRIGTDGKALDGPLTTKGALAIYGWSASGAYLAYASDLSTVSVLNLGARTTSVLGQKFTGYFDLPIDYRESIAYIVDGAAGLEHGASVRIALADGGNDRTLFVPPPAGDASDLEDLATVDYR